MPEPKLAGLGHEAMPVEVPEPIFAVGRVEHPEPARFVTAGYLQLKQLGAFKKAINSALERPLS